MRILKRSFLLVLLYPVFLFGQHSVPQLPPGLIYHNLSAIDGTSIGWNEVPHASSGYTKQSTIGDAYLFDEWKKANIFFYGEDAVYEILIKLNLYNNNVEFRDSAGIKVIDGSWVKKIEFSDVLTTNIFLNKKELGVIGTNSTGFYELITEGKLSLYSKNDVTIKKADYNIITNTGSKSDKVIKTQKFLIGDHEDGISIIAGKKDLFKQFGEKSNSVKNFIKTKKLKYKKRSDLVKIINFYNSLES